MLSAAGTSISPSSTAARSSPTSSPTSSTRQLNVMFRSSPPSPVTPIASPSLSLDGDEIRSAVLDIGPAALGEDNSRVPNMKRVTPCEKVKNTCSWIWNGLNNKFFFYRPEVPFFDKTWQTVFSAYFSYEARVKAIQLVGQYLFTNAPGLQIIGIFAFMINFHYSQKTIGAGLGKFCLFEPRFAALANANEEIRTDIAHTRDFADKSTKVIVALAKNNITATEMIANLDDPEAKDEEKYAQKNALRRRAKLIGVASFKEKDEDEAAPNHSKKCEKCYNTACCCPTFSRICNC